MVVQIVIACVWGFVTKCINEDKGYEGGFAWGFWLGFIGVIVVACKSDNRRWDIYSKITDRYSWQCAFCNRINPGHKILCECGKTENESRMKFENVSNDKPKKSAMEIQLEGAKKMLEDGLITEEEYEAKRKKILGI